MESIYTGTIPHRKLNHWGECPVRQRLYIETILTSGRAIQIGNPHDPGWRTQARWCSTLLDAHILKSSADSALAPWVPALAAGVALPECRYCTNFNDLFNGRALDPTGVTLMVVNAAMRHQPPKLINTAPLNTWHVHQFVESTNPDSVLRLATIESQTNEHPMLTCLDDGRFITVLRFHRDGEGLVDFLARRCRDELWIRWLRDSYMGIPLRDIDAGGQRLDAMQLLPRIMENAALPLAEHVGTVFQAVAEGLWPEEAAAMIAHAPRVRFSPVVEKCLRIWTNQHPNGNRLHMVKL